MIPWWNRPRLDVPTLGRRNVRWAPTACRLFGHRWSRWWTGSDAAWYRRCERGCGIPYERRPEWEARMERVWWCIPPSQQR